MELPWKPSKTGHLSSQGPGLRLVAKDYMRSVQRNIAALVDGMSLGLTSMVTVESYPLCLKLESMPG